MFNLKRRSVYTVAKHIAAWPLIAIVLLFALGEARYVAAQQVNPGVQQFGAVTSGHGVNWGPGVGQIQDSGSAPSGVLSVFGRAGNVIAAVGDYTFAQISGSLACAQLPGLTGDITSAACVTTLATVNANVGAFGGVNSIPSFTVDGKGRITAAAANVPAIPFTELTGSLACGQTPAYIGDTTKAAGSCTTVTVKVNGISFAASAAADTVPVITSANTTATYTALPNCTSGVLQYATATHLFSCGAAGTGTVTNVATGTGLTGGPISTTGTISIVASRPAGCVVFTTAAITCADGSAGANAGTYTVPALTTWLEIKCIGNSGGGAGSGTAPGNGGSAGNVTITGTGVNITCGGGNGAVTSSGGTGGGSASGGYLNIAGGVGGNGGGVSSSNPGAMGCQSVFGGGGAGGASGGGAGIAAVANTGSGGGGGGVNVTPNGGGGGQCGGYVEAIVPSPPATLTYAISTTIGTGGGAGTGGAAGGAGAGGRIVFIPHFGA